MNNNLENKIKEHAEAIFGGEPLQGHRDRFAEKLETVNRKRRIPLRKIYSYISIAAVFAGFIILLHHFYFNESIQESESLSEVQNYYSMLLQDQIDSIEQLLQQVNEDDRPGLRNDIENLLKDADFEIQSSGKNNAEFIVMTYSTKIEVLQHIHDILDTNL